MVLAPVIAPLIVPLIAITACTRPAPVPPARPAPAATPAPRGADQLLRIEASPDLDGKRVGTTTGPTLVIVFASWCPHCHDELDEIAKLRAAHPLLRVLGVNYRGHEEYDHRGNAEAVRRYVVEHAAWLRVVPAGDALFDALGRPSAVPTLYIYDRDRALVASYSRRERAMPDADELDALLRRIGG